MKLGIKVKLSSEFKSLLTNNGYSQHVREFENSIGIIDSAVRRATSFEGPGVDVNWGTGLSYPYETKHLINATSLPNRLQKLILSDDNSKPNKLWLAIAWNRDGYYIDWRWQGIEKYSRLQFRFSEDGEWFTAKSHEEDVMPKMKFVIHKAKVVTTK